MSDMMDIIEKMQESDLYTRQEISLMDVMLKGLKEAFPNANLNKEIERLHAIFSQKTDLEKEFYAPENKIKSFRKTCKEFLCYFEGYSRNDSHAMRKLLQFISEIEKIMFGKIKTQSWS